MIIKSKKNGVMDSFATPQELYNECCELWNLIYHKCNLDICATKENKKCLWFLTEKDNALNYDHWLDLFGEIKHYNGKIFIWCNPPHSKTKEFVKLCYNLWTTYGVTVIMLIPLNTLSSNYAFQFIHGFAQIKFLKGRPKFLDPITNKPSKYNAVNGYVTICYKANNG